MRTEFFWKTNTKCTKKPQFSILTQPFSDFCLFQKYVNAKVGTKKILNGVAYHPCVWLSYFLKLLKVFSKMLVGFSLTFLKTCFSQDKRCGENYNFLYQNSIRKYEVDWEHRLTVLCMIYDFSKYGDFTVL